MALQISATYSSNTYSAYELMLEGNNSLSAAQYLEQMVIPAFAFSWNSSLPVKRVLRTFRESYLRMKRTYHEPRGEIDVEMLERGNGGMFTVKRAPVWFGINGSPVAIGGGLELFLAKGGFTNKCQDVPVSRLDWFGVTTEYHYLAVERSGENNRIVITGFENLSGEVARLYMQTSGLGDATQRGDLADALEHLLSGFPLLERR